MIEAAIKLIADLAKKANKLTHTQIEGRDVVITSDGEYDFLRPPVEKAETISACTLSSVVEYVKGCDDHTATDLIVHVVSPYEVRVLGKLDTDRMERQKYLMASCRATGYQRMGEYVPVEDFVIHAQCNFVEGAGDLPAVLKLVGNMRAGKETTAVDDGVSQEVVKRSGVAGSEKASIQNPVTLYPRTGFGEVEAEEELYIVRFNGGGDDATPQVMLVRVNDSAWVDGMVETLRLHLIEKLGADVSVIA